MSLLQISEPESNLPINIDEFAVGIDLGTTNSVIARSENNTATVLGPILPSVYKEVRSIKRLMGSNSIIENLRPEEISSHILITLKKQAEDILKHSISKAVITVPAHFDDAARQATKLAANLAGLEVLRLINEPTAAAVAYGLDQKAEGTYLIYDFGGGTFDVSILRMQQGIFQVLATGGDINLGGDDIDNAIMKHFQFPSDLYYIAREAKEYLSNHEIWSSEYGSLSIHDLNALAKPFIDRTIEICKDVINQSKININDIKEIILVGGSTRLNLVKQTLTISFKKPLDNIDPDLVVACGAAIQAEALTKGSENLLLDVTSLSIGLEVMSGLNERIINRNSPLPTSVTKHFTTYQDNQNGIIFNIVQGEREMAADCRLLAKFELKNIPPMKAGLAKVAVTFTVDADGLLTVSAIEEHSGTKQHIEVKPSYGLNKNDIDTMLEQAYINADQDILHKKLAEVKFAASNNINSLTQAIEEDSDLLGDDKAEILKLISNLSLSLSTNKLDEIEKANDTLEKRTSKFIEDRLNRKIKVILSGKTTTEINHKIN